MPDNNVAAKYISVGARLYRFLERNPQNYDVSFCVGPQKVVVKALKIILKASSLVLEKEFEDTWDKLGSKLGEGIIPLPEFDARAFKLFIKLLILDTWTLEALRDLNLPADQLLNLTSICKRFGMHFEEESLKELTQQFTKNFNSFVKTPPFLRLSQSSLEAILSSDDIEMEEMEIYDWTIKWAEHHCNINGKEKTGENIRHVLGDCLFQIRFPTMNFTDFTKAMRTKDILTAEESVEIYNYIGLEETEKSNYDTTRIAFGTKPRLLQQPEPEHISLPEDCATLSLHKVFEIVENPGIACNGVRKCNYIQSKQKISIMGLGFLGPIEADSYYDVSVEVKRRTNKKDVAIVEEMEKRIFAQKGEIFQFIFDEPIIFEPIADDSWGNCYKIYYSLKGPATWALVSESSEQCVKAKGTHFSLCWGSQQMLQILFKKNAD